MSNPYDYIGKRYRNGDSYFTVIGYTDRPVVFMRDPITGERHCEVIGCPNHLHMEEITAEVALTIAEDKLREAEDDPTPPEAKP